VSEADSTNSEIAQLYRELEYCRKQLREILEIRTSHPELESHPGGIVLGLSDWLMEEVIILGRIKKLMATEEETKLYLQARDRALVRYTEANALMDECVAGFRAGLLYATVDPLTPVQMRSVHLQTENNFSFAFICGILARLEAVKGKGYQASWQRRGEVDGVMVNMDRKYDRLDAVVRRNSTGETTSQVLGDLAVYAIKFLTLRAEINSEELFNWIEEVRNL
jgi:hypothetical protein